VREAIGVSERAAARSSSPELEFTRTLSQQILGNRGLRNRYLESADAGRGVTDVTGPLTSVEQWSILKSGRFSDDLANGPFDGSTEFKERRDK
jgi:conjugal transfer mating pair stabilization protein TraG